MNVCVGNLLHGSTFDLSTKRQHPIGSCVKHCRKFESEHLQHFGELLIRKVQNLRARCSNLRTKGFSSLIFIVLRVGIRKMICGSNKCCNTVRFCFDFKQKHVMLRLRKIIRFQRKIKQTSYEKTSRSGIGVHRKAVVCKFISYCVCCVHVRRTVWNESGRGPGTLCCMIFGSFLHLLRRKRIDFGFSDFREGSRGRQVLFLSDVHV